ncbi:hypothetical protein H8959_022343 [Pygathrix nigripes]
MNFLFLVWAALGFLTQVIPARGGGSKCVSDTPGYCRTHCHQEETALFMCNPFRKCCINYSFLPKPDLPQLIDSSTGDLSVWVLQMKNAKTELDMRKIDWENTPLMDKGEREQPQAGRTFRLQC